MKNFLFKTNTNINDNNYWIDSDYIKEMKIEANTVEEALTTYVKNAQDDFYVIISKNAIANKQKMYRDSRKEGSVQIGYVLAALTEIQKESGSWVKKWLSLWIEIEEVSSPFASTEIE